MSSLAELQKTQFQLQTVEASLRLDPNNADLKTLAADLREAVKLIEAILGSAPAAGAGAGGGDHVVDHGGASGGPGGVVEANLFKIGDLVEAFYASDKKWYPAVVQAVSKDGLVYTILYEGYNETEVVKADRVRVMSKEALKRRADIIEAAEKQKQIEKKKAKSEKNVERIERSKAVDSEFKAKQSSWQNFAQKKSKLIPGAKHKSMFASPESVDGKVGVVGSGKGMSDFLKRKKHEFSVDDAADGE